MTQEQVHEILAILSFLDIKLSKEEKTVCKFLMLRHKDKQPVEKPNNKQLKEKK